MRRLRLPHARKPTRLPSQWEAYRRLARPSPGEVRMMLLGGVFAGLVGYQVAVLATPAAADPLQAVQATKADPWAESRLSRKILEAQEGAPDPIFPAAPAIQANAAAVRVIDGDTFSIGGEKIRIADIDTPETHPPRCAHEAELGARATRRLEVLLAEGDFVLRPIAGRDRDGYGRRLRIVERGGRSIGDVLVSEGLARPWTGRRMPWCA